MNKMENTEIIAKRTIDLKLAKRLIGCLIFVFVFEFFLFPLPVLANNEETSSAEENLTIEDVLDTAIVAEEFSNQLPENSAWGTEKSFHVTITAYSSDVRQTDDSPCITANGFDVCQHGEEDTIAANFLYFGTKVRIPELFGDKVFIVRDRMNERYNNRIDIWMTERADAKNFGVKIAKIEILE
jgi:3D (Asp-Asp-Asp) domain-containing protein